MRAMRFLGALALVTGAPAPAQPSGGTVSVVKGADPAIWEGRNGSGPIVHRASKVALPEQIAGFGRMEVAAVSATDVFARYRAKDGPTEIAASLYLFKPGPLPEHRLKGSVESFAALNPQSFLWSAGPLELGGEPRLRATKMVFKTGIGPGTVMDYLYFVPLGPWTVKVRGTITGVVKDTAPEAKLDAFVRALPWPEVLAANGACAGAACTAPAVEPFRSHIGELMLSGLAAMTIKFDPKAEAELPVVGRTNPLAPTEIRGSETEPLVYVARVPKLATYRLVRLPDIFRKMFEEGYGVMSIDKPLYGLMVDPGGAKPFIPRFYNGKPDAAAFGKAVEELVLIGAGNPFLLVGDYARSLPD